jgi:acetyl-CoA C-acetyltransferase
MGQTAENVADMCGVSRADQDEFALRSQKLCAAAVASGFQARQIAPVALADGAVFAADESPRPQTTAEALAALAPVFRPDGSVTAGNSCPLNDGAAALVVARAELADEVEAPVKARIVGTAVSALSPEIMGLGPVAATRRVLQRTGLRLDDIDLIEINEAFAAQVLASARELEIDESKLNVNGGAIALGHPFGMTGVRLIGTAMHALRERDQSIALVALCVGNGQGMAMVLERVH